MTISPITWTGSDGVYAICADEVGDASNDDKFTFIRKAEPTLSAHNFTTTYVEDSHALFDSITVYSGPSVVFFGLGIEKLLVRNSDILINGGRVQSANADGVHSNGCRFGPDVIRCHFAGMTDDGFNNYGPGYHPVEQEGQDRFRIYTRESQTNLSRFLRVGDQLALFRESSGDLLTFTTVVQHHGEKTVQGRPCHDVTVAPPVSQSVVMATIAQVDSGTYKDRFFNLAFSGDDFLV